MVTVQIEIVGQCGLPEALDPRTQKPVRSWAMTLPTVPRYGDVIEYPHEIKPGGFSDNYSYPSTQLAKGFVIEIAHRTGLQQVSNLYGNGDSYLAQTWVIISDRNPFGSVGRG